MARKKTAVAPKLTDPERDLLADMERGYQLETDSLGGNPVLRSLKGGEVLRPASVNRSTIKALEERGLTRTNKTGKRTRPAHHCLASTRHPATDPMSSGEMQHKFPGDMQGFWLQLGAILGQFAAQNPANVDQ